MQQAPYVWTHTAPLPKEQLFTAAHVKDAAYRVTYHFIAVGASPDHSFQQQKTTNYFDEIMHEASKDKHKSSSAAPLLTASTGRRSTLLNTMAPPPKTTTTAAQEPLRAHKKIKFDGEHWIPRAGTEGDTLIYNTLLCHAAPFGGSKNRLHRSTHQGNNNRPPTPHATSNQKGRPITT
jgi:hypothetical protein